MAGADNEYRVNADPSGFTAGMERMQASARQAASQVQSSFQAIEGQMKQLTGALKTVTGMLGTLTAIMAGGAAFKEIIGASNAWTGEAKKLSMQLGVTTERASVMMVAMRHLGLDSEVMTMAAGKMAKQIATNGQAFEKLGVSVKDSTGQYRATLDIMGDLNTKLKEIKNPIEQNIAGTQVYGKSWNDVRGTMKLTTEEIKNAEQKTKDLGLVVGEEGAGNVKKYKESLADMKLVMTSLEVQAGAVLLPVFVKLGGWLGSVGPVVGKAMSLAMESLVGVLATVGDVVGEVRDLVMSGFKAMGELIASVMGTKAPGALEVFANALKVVEVAFVGLKVAVKVALDFISGLIELWVAGVMRSASAAERALHMDFAGAKKAWETGTAIIEGIEQKHVDKLLKIAGDGKDKMDEILMRAPGQGAEIKDKQIKGGPTYDFSKDEGKDGKEKSRLHEWEAKLAFDKDGYSKQQAMAGTALEYSHAMERDYWQKILATATLSKEEKAMVEKKYYAEMALIRKDAFENEIAGEKVSLETFKNNHLARLDIANRIYQDNVARYSADSKEAKEALAEVYKEQRAYADQSIATAKAVAEAKRNAELAGIDAAQQDAELQVALRRATDAQLIEQERGFEAKRYQIKMQAMLDQQALMRGPDEDPTALAQLHAQIEALEQQHQLKLSAIKNKATLEQNKGMTSTYGSMESGMARVISGTAQGTMKMSALLQNMMQVVTGAVIDMVAQSAAKWLMNLLITETTSKASALSQISASAGVAGAAATASAAAIPLYGWIIAPEAGLAASASAMAYMPMASARNGYDIPAGLNPLTQLHEKEMVLPQAQADAVRDMAEGGGAGAATINYHDYSGQLSPAEIRKNVRVIAEALKDHAKKS
ncbi:hypothetical protein AAKU55_004913 [Oxalobacteraceae bacterium GrIS 1.11]